ncbi:MAG: hypothetical protein JO154_01825 [Chitinophaga sp.]|uniref:hypothetical protein n=1 Tax=Chitinophaga sp. TaxID=1869181 RepID=UPI0025C2F85B|nr:hypothetical protein [Chitinophaga sp.]MBV8251318.1 hypothetical protein [Chitinophaga sp.]
MNWSRNYNLFLFFGDTAGANAPWQQDVWKTQIAPVLDTVLHTSAYYKKTGIGTFQYVPKPNSVYSEAFKPGRLTWNDIGHDKWTLNAHSGPRRFHFLDIWTPSRGICAKLESAPDVYFSLCNERDTYRLNTVAFEWMAVLAVAEEANMDTQTQAKLLAQVMNAKRLIWRKQGWQQRSRNEHWQLPGSIQDFLSANISDENIDLHQLSFADIQFEPFWKILL